MSLRQSIRIADGVSFPARRTARAIIAFTAVCLVTGSVSAWDILTPDRTLMIASNRHLPDETFILGGDLKLMGQADDDLFAITKGKVDLKGSAGNDLWAIAGEVLIDGKVADHARIAAFRGVTVNGNIGGSLAAYGSTIHVATNAVVGGASYLVGENLLLEGTFTGAANFQGVSVTLAGHFMTNITIIAAQNIVLVPGAVIDGNLAYRAPSELVPPEDVTIRGRLYRLPPAVEKPTTIADWAFKLAMLAGAIIVGLLLVTMFPAHVTRTMQHIHQSQWKCLLAGLASFCLLPMLALVVAITIVGFPLALITGMFYIAILYLGKFYAALMIGRLLLLRRPGASAQVALMLGLLVVFLGVNLPGPLGAAAWCWATWLGMGAIIMANVDRRVPVVLVQPPPPGPV